MLLDKIHRPSVSVVIVNWNAGQLLRECLASIQESGAYPDCVCEVIVVDNGSADGSSGFLDAPDQGVPMRLLRNPNNRGFAAACNQGAAIAGGAHLLFLNPDCRVRAGSIERCATVLAQHSEIGVAGIGLADDSGTIQHSCHRFPCLRNLVNRACGLSTLSKFFSDGSMKEWAHDEDREVDHVIGAFYMVRAKEFRELGGFDERFFVYLEDLDLSLRYWQRGQHCMFLASPASYHKGGGVSEQARAARLFFATRSRILYAFKHFSALKAWIHLVVTVAVEPVARFVQLVAQRRLSEAPEVIRAFGLLYRGLPDMLQSARRN